MGRTPVGFEPLDALLGGGIEHGIVSAFVGEPAAGKTTIGILLALASLPRGEAVFLDTEGGLSPERVLQIAPGAPLKRILVKKIPDFASQEKAIMGLPKLKPSCVVLDSAVHHYRTALTDKTSRELNSRLALQLSFLNNFALEREIPVLATGHVYRKEGKVKVVAGDVLSYIAKTIVLVEKRPGAGKRSARIEKSRCVAEGASRSFSITGSGLA